MGTLGGYVPKTALGRRLMELRECYAAKGGKFLSREELDAEITSRRLGYDHEAIHDRQEGVSVQPKADALPEKQNQTSVAADEG